MNTMHPRAMAETLAHGLVRLKEAHDFRYARANHALAEGYQEVPSRPYFPDRADN